MPLYDEVGYWSEVKLDIVRDYAAAYSRILAAQPGLHHVYIDAFAGAGQHVSKTTGGFIPGSPRNALLVKPPFEEYYFIDIKAEKVEELEKLADERADVHVLRGDCNDLLQTTVFPRVKWEQYRRGLCLLDPYGLSLNWEVISAAGGGNTGKGVIDLFLNFPVMDMNRNVLWGDPEGVDPKQIERMDRFWGENSWRRATYSRQQGLFGNIEEKRTGNRSIIDAFRKKLKDVAGFKNVPEPIPMRNEQGAIVYYLFFASQKPVAQKIVDHIFNKYRERMG